MLHINRILILLYLLVSKRIGIYTYKKKKEKNWHTNVLTFLQQCIIYYSFSCHMGNMKYLFEGQQKLITKSNVTETTIFTIVELSIFIVSHLSPSLISLYHLPFTACLATTVVVKIFVALVILVDQRVIL